ERAGSAMQRPSAPPVPARRPLRSVADDRSARPLLRPARAGHRVLPERGDLAGPPQAVGGAAPVALPAVRDADPPVGQRSGGRLAPPVREVPALREPDPGPVPVGGGRL